MTSSPEDFETFRPSSWGSGKTLGAQEFLMLNLTMNLTGHFAAGDIVLEFPRRKCRGLEYTARNRRY